jgi:N-acetylneuraminic acid mutarotase
MRLQLKDVTKCVILIPWIALYALTLQAQNWETLASMPERLTFPVVGVVDGKIHVMGGGGTGGATAKHYQYDPVTNAWTSKADVPYKAQQPAGTANGNKIHFFGGGFPTSGAPVKSHYIYDATTDTWSKAADLTQARAIHYGVTLNGEVYTLAGQGVADWCEVYQEATNSWVRKNNLPDSKFWYGAHIVTHGSIFRFCGGGYTAPVSTANRYDPSSDSWSPLPNVPVAIHGLDGAAIGDKIYLVGGYHDFVDSDEVWIYDINTQTYSKGVSLPVGRTYHNIVVIDNCLYSIGGNNAIDPNVSQSLLRFCPDINSSTEEKLKSWKPSLQSFNDHISLSFTESQLNKWNVQIVDLNGKRIYNNYLNPVKQNPYILYTGDLSNGYYHIIVADSRSQFYYPYFIFK